MALGGSYTLLLIQKSLLFPISSQTLCCSWPEFYCQHLCLSPKMFCPLDHHSLFEGQTTALGNCPQGLLSTDGWYKWMSKNPSFSQSSATRLRSVVHCGQFWVVLLCWTPFFLIFAGRPSKITNLTSPLWFCFHCPFRKAPWWGTAWWHAENARRCTGNNIVLCPLWVLFPSILPLSGLCIGNVPNSASS